MSSLHYDCAVVALLGRWLGRRLVRRGFGGVFCDCLGRRFGIWTLKDNLGRQYAAVSGDHNPIHLHSWSAKPFGFPRAIAHGMWTKAHCLASLRLPDAFETSVRFKQPILLPSRVTFGEAGDRYAVHGHLEGTLTPT